MKFTLLIFVAAVVADYQRTINADCIVMYNDTNIVTADDDVFTTEYKLPQNVYAIGFTVEYYNTYKLVNNTIAQEIYVLYQCGVSKPSASNFPVGTKFFEIPLTSVAAPETVPYAFIEMLGLDARIESVSPYIVSACGQKLLACGDATPDYTVMGNVTALRAALGSSVDGVLETGRSAYEKSFAFSAANDPGLLNRAEWIKFLGLFFNQEKNASDIFDGISQAYADAKAVASAGPFPVVAVAQHYVYGTDESYQLSWAQYKLNLIQDAGSVPLSMNSVAAINGVRVNAYSTTTLEFAWDDPVNTFPDKASALAAFMQALSTVDIVIDETYAVNPATYGWTAFLNEYNITDNNTTSSGSWWSNKRIFREDGLITQDGWLDFFEGAIARPSQLLTDMVRVVNSARPSTATTALQSPFIWLRHINEVPVVIGASSCTRLTSCTTTPTPICPFVKFCPTTGDRVLLLGDLSTNSCSYAPCDPPKPKTSDASTIWSVVGLVCALAAWLI